MIYLYGLYEGAADNLHAAVCDLNGLQGALEIVTVGAWSLVFSDHDEEEVLPKRRNMLAHTQVLERMISVGSVLPARFGLVAETSTHAVELITAQSSLVAAEFDRIRDHVELGVRISFDRATALEATLRSDKALQAERDALTQKGAEAHYAIADFGGRLADHLDRRRGMAQRAMLEALKPHVQDHVLRKPEEDTEVLRAEYLLKAEEQDAFVACVDAAAKALDFAPGADADIKIIGPVPMYNFVRLSLTVEPDGVAA